METVVALPGNQFFGYSRHGLLTWSHADGKPREQNWDWNFAGGRSAPDSVAPLANRAVIAGTLSPTPEEDQRAGHSAEYDYIGPLTWIIELFDLQEGTSRVLHRESYLYKGPNMDGEFGTAPGPSVALSPDGKYIAFFAPEGEVCIIPNRFDPQTEAVLSPVSKSGLRGPLRIIRCDPMPSVDPKKTHANPLTP